MVGGLCAAANDLSSKDIGYGLHVGGVLGLMASKALESFRQQKTFNQSRLDEYIQISSLR